MIYRSVMIPAFLLTLVQISDADPPEITRYTLQNGMRVVHLYCRDSENVGIFSYLPLGLAADGAGAAQWSHLVEHLTVLSTGPIENYQERNAEVMTQGMHLDFMANAGRWKEGLDVQARWLEGAPFTKELLDREISNALNEVKVTDSNLYTHKWAVAAWNQVYRHGKSHAAVCGDLLQAKADKVEAYRDEYLVRPDRVCLLVAGNVAPGSVRPVVEKKFGKIPAHSRNLPAAARSTPPRGGIDATWDLETSYLFVSYPIPGFGHRDFPALHVAGKMFYSSLYMDAELKRHTTFPMSGTDLVSPESTFLYIGLPLKPDASPDEVKARVQSHVDMLIRGDRAFQVHFLARNLAAQYNTLPDLDKVEKPPNVTRLMMEGNLWLQRGLLEAQFGDGLPKFAEALEKVSSKDVIEAAGKYLKTDAKCALTLRPR